MRRLCTSNCCCLSLCSSNWRKNHYLYLFVKFCVSGFIKLYHRIVWWPYSKLIKRHHMRLFYTFTLNCPELSWFFSRSWCSWRWPLQSTSSIREKFRTKGKRIWGFIYAGYDLHSDQFTWSPHTGRRRTLYSQQGHRSMAVLKPVIFLLWGKINNHRSMWPQLLYVLSIKKKKKIFSHLYTYCSSYETCSHSIFLSENKCICVFI